MSSDSVRKLFTNPQFLSDYSKWLSDPITVQVLAAAKSLAEPSSLTRPDPNAALYLHGVYVGFNRMLSFISGADQVVESAEEQQVEESYGEDKVLSAMYPQIKKARARQVNAVLEPVKKKGRPKKAPTA